MEKTFNNPFLGPEDDELERIRAGLMDGSITFEFTPETNPHSSFDEQDPEERRENLYKGMREYIKEYGHVIYYSSYDPEVFWKFWEEENKPPVYLDTTNNLNFVPEDAIINMDLHDHDKQKEMIEGLRHVRDVTCYNAYDKDAAGCPDNIKFLYIYLTDFKYGKDLPCAEVYSIKDNIDANILDVMNAITSRCDTCCSDIELTGADARMTLSVGANIKNLEMGFDCQGNILRFDMIKTPKPGFFKSVMQHITNFRCVMINPDMFAQIHDEVPEMFANPKVVSTLVCSINFDFNILDGRYVENLALMADGYGVDIKYPGANLQIGNIVEYDPVFEEAIQTITKGKKTKNARI